MNLETGTVPKRSYQTLVHMLADFGVTGQAFANMYEAQNGLCAICDKKMLGRDCHIDHDHASGSLRKLLCGTCNSGLGMFKDSIRNLARAIVYLEEHGKSFI